MIMRKIGALALSLMFLTLVIQTSYANAAENPAEPELSAQSAVLFCPDNGEVIFQKSANDRMKIASTTKIMTTLLTLEEAEKDDKVLEFTLDMAAEGSSMYLQEGNKLRLSDLAVGMMLASGNDGANAAAVTIGGSAEKFAEMMNKRAEEIGMNDTHFVTPSGLDDENHYSTAYDMALLMGEAMKNQDFAEIAKMKNGSVELIYPEGKILSYTNHNKLLSLYEYCIGGKTGFTKAAGRCLVTAAEKDGVTLIAVTLNAPSDWNDHINLYNYGFSLLESVEISKESLSVEVPVAGTGEKIKLVPDKNLTFVRKIGGQDFDIEENVRYYIPKFIYQPVMWDEPYGKAVVYLGNNKLESFLLFPEEKIENSHM
ncbi:MAG: D-alanyl-D-alanine carboxypeptidase family protein [Acutalibacteraceae bacterium]|nr:D-alanyl-D-alanine carboxypeptidase family protein [Acutalibacteraceae bacterium]